MVSSPYRALYHLCETPPRDKVVGLVKLNNLARAKDPQIEFKRNILRCRVDSELLSLDTSDEIHMCCVPLVLARDGYGTALDIGMISAQVGLYLDTTIYAGNVNSR